MRCWYINRPLLDPPCPIHGAVSPIEATRSQPWPVRWVRSSPPTAPARSASGSLLRSVAEGRLQLGLEYQRSDARRGFQPYAALDVSLYEEDDWKANGTLQTGFVRKTSGGSVWRVGVEFYDGRSVIGELFQEREAHFAYGIWIDP